MTVQAAHICQGPRAASTLTAEQDLLLARLDVLQDRKTSANGNSWRRWSKTCVHIVCVCVFVSGEASSSLAFTHPRSAQQLGMAEAAGGARSEAAEANAAGESAALAAAPDPAGGGGKRRRCEDTAEGAARKKARSICPHGRERSQCTECGGAGICPHQRQRSRCKECGGASICQHHSKSQFIQWSVLGWRKSFNASFGLEKQF